MELRPYQQEVLNNVRKAMLKKHKKIVVVCGCGSGKSVMSAEMAKKSAKKGNKILFLVHRKELINQIEATYSMWGVDMENCDFSMVQTYRRHLKPPEFYNLIIIDECHLNHNVYKTIVAHHSEAFVVGWTATPIRLGAGGLGDLYGSLVQGVSTEWLIQNKYLAPFKYYSVPLADTTKLHTKMGDFVKGEISSLMQDSHIYGETVTQWEKIAKNKQTIVYCASVQASENTAEQFRKAGHKAEHIDGNTPAELRTEIMQKFRNGELKILCNMDLFGVGLDVPNCECVVLLRPTKSLALYIQQAMRSMRYVEGKTALILDHVRNCYLHGLPDDNREWELKSKKKNENIVKIKECKNCFAVYSPSLQKCPYCGTENRIVREIVDRKVIDTDLVEVERLQNIKLTEFKAETFEEVVKYQKIKGYKFPWVIRYCESNKIPYPAKYNFYKKFLKNY